MKDVYAGPVADHRSSSTPPGVGTPLRASKRSTPPAKSIGREERGISAQVSATRTIHMGGEKMDG